MKTALEVAEYFLHKIDRDAGDTISQLRLVKLVYYAQAWSLVFRNQPLFDEEIEAWRHGPVAPSVVNTYKSFRRSSIPAPSSPMPDFSHREQQILEFVHERYGNLGAIQLSDLTHKEDPWKIARQGIGADERSNSIITWEAMRSFYSRESPIGFVPDGQESQLLKLTYALLELPEEKQLELNADSAETMQIVLDKAERQHPDYAPTLAARVKDALASTDRKSVV